MTSHNIDLAEAHSLLLSLPDEWLASSWEGMKGVFYRKEQAGLFAPNITIAAYPVQVVPTLQQLRDQLIATYNTALGHKLLGVEKITFLENSGVRAESVVIAPNGLRVVQSVRAGTLQISETETMQIEIAGSCTQKQASDYLPEMRSALRFAKLQKPEIQEQFVRDETPVTQQAIDELLSLAPKRFPSPKRLASLPPLKAK